MSRRLAGRPGSKEARREGDADHLIDPKDGPDVHARVDVTATVQRIEDDAIFASQSLLDDHRFVQLLRNEYGRLPRSSECVYHDVVRQHV